MTKVIYPRPTVKTRRFAEGLLEPTPSTWRKSDDRRSAEDEAWWTGFQRGLDGEKSASADWDWANTIRAHMFTMGLIAGENARQAEYEAWLDSLSVGRPQPSDFEDPYDPAKLEYLRVGRSA